MLFLLSSSSSSLLSSSSFYYHYYYYHYHYHYYYHYYYYYYYYYYCYYYYCHYSVNNIPYQCDITCAGHFTLDALASRTVACSNNEGQWTIIKYQICIFHFNQYNINCTLKLSWPGPWVCDWLSISQPENCWSVCMPGRIFTHVFGISPLRQGHFSHTWESSA